MKVYNGLPMMKSFQVFGKNNSEGLPATHWSKENTMLSTEGYPLLLIGPELYRVPERAFKRLSGKGLSE